MSDIENNKTETQTETEETETEKEYKEHKEHKEHIERLKRNYEKARNGILQCQIKAAGGQKKESEYGKACQDLIRAGVAPQLKKKYRCVI